MIEVCKVASLQEYKIGYGRNTEVYKVWNDRRYTSFATGILTVYKLCYRNTDGILDLLWKVHNTVKIVPNL